MSSEYLIVFSTCPSREVVDRIADALVEGGYAACVNIISGLTSVYRWQGEIHRDVEWLLIAKTSHAAYRGLEDAIRELHPDEVPEIVAAPLVSGLDDYLHWVSLQTSG